MKQSGEAQSSSREADLEIEVQRLRLLVCDQQSQIEVLERQLKETSALSPTQLVSQIDGVTTASFAAYHGPNTITHFNEFPFDKLIEEFQQHAPDVWQFLNLLGNMDRFSNDKICWKLLNA